MNNISTIKLTKETKNKLINLDFSKKDMTFDDIINVLINKYNNKKR